MARQNPPEDRDELGVSDTRFLAIAIGSLFGVVASVTGLLWATGLLDFTGTDAAAKVFTAVLAFLGTVFGTIVTLVGLMLKRSVDGRTLALKADAEARLRLDTAIKAVELFKNASGAGTPAEAAGALFALARLGEWTFALRLLEHLWPGGTIESPSAVWLINDSLNSTDQDIQELASEVLRENANELADGEGGKWWPANYEISWPASMPILAREQLLDARIDVLLSHRFAYWKRSELNTDIATLVLAFREDSSPRIKQSAAAFLITLLEIYDPEEPRVISHPKGDLDIENVRKEITDEYGASFSAAYAQDQEKSDQLKTWIEPQTKL